MTAPTNPTPGLRDTDTDIATAVSALLADAAAQALDRPTREALEEVRRRLTGPVRLAFAGRVKAGKSTLLNALVGEQLAPTDAGECTRVVTWYVGANRTEALVHTRDGQVLSRPYRRQKGPVEVDLGVRVEDVDHVEIRWPSPRLRAMSLIDTPGISSLSPDVARRADVLLPEGGSGPRLSTHPADAVVYLLRHAHSADLHFLEALAGSDLAGAGPSNTLGVLSRADEMGSCLADALAVAARIARRYERHPRLHRVCPVVIPVAGLLAQAAVTVREGEYRLLTQVAALPEAISDELLLSVDRFAADNHDVRVLPLERSHLLERFGLFGVRFGVDAIRRGRVRSADDLALALGAESGLDRLRRVVISQFGQRARLLVSRSAVLVLQAALARGAVGGHETLQARLEEILAGAHGFVEIRLLDELMSGTLDITPERRAELERLFGGSGAAPTSRLGLSDTASTEQIRSAALNAVLRWQRIAESPLATRTTVTTARVAVRTCETILALGSRDT